MLIDIDLDTTYHLNVKQLCDRRIEGVSMRKSREEAARTRKRIVKVAAQKFRRQGIGGISVADLMDAAGLTHGGFYRHFDSKDQLVAEASASGAAALARRMTAALEGQSPKSGLKTIAEGYLSPGHRDNASDGCVLAALGSELARADKSARTAATRGYLDLVDLVARQFNEASPEAARSKALATVSLMIGALTMSRVVKDPGLSAEILQSAQKHITNS
jgi:TetR/AcrR family transcriptional regulator, transcriptional repressor for nem operon